MDMVQYILDMEPKIRLAGFLGLFVIMGLLEAIMPRRKRVDTRAHRWVSNLGIVFVSSFAAKLFFKFMFVGTLVQFASMIQAKGWGLFNYFIPLDNMAGDAATWLHIAKGVILMDMIIYFQHRFVHDNKYLWDFHKVHHADMDLDVTSGNRFHPVEILFSLVVKIVAILALGVHPVSIIIFEVILNGMAQWNHANFKLPLFIEKPLRMVFVTQDFHRVHHSTYVNETNSNYGFNLSIWDYMFGTYIAQPRKGHENMDVGLVEYRNPKKLGLMNLIFRLPYDQGAVEYATAENKEDIEFDESKHKPEV